MYAPLARFLGRLGGAAAPETPAFRARRYRRQRLMGFPWLRFMPSLEAEYQRWAERFAIARLDLLHGMGVMSIVGFVIVDRWLAGHRQPLAAELLLIVAVAGLLLPVVAVRFAWGRQWFRPLLLLGLMVLALSLVGVVAIDRASNPGFPYESLMLCLFYLFLLAAVPFGEVVLCGWLLYVAHITLAFLFPQNLSPYFEYEVYYLLLANCFGMLARYVTEHQLRTTFLVQFELACYAGTDALTGALNRRAFLDHARRALAHARREGSLIGLLMLDLDEFKAINDTHGHWAGDEVLRKVVGTFRQSLRRPLDAVGRLGGDEFVALWYDVDPRWLEETVEALVADLAAAELPGLVSFKGIGVSGGALLITPQSKVTVEAALRAADELLYTVKRDRAGCIFIQQVDALPLVASPAGPPRPGSARGSP